MIEKEKDVYVLASIDKQGTTVYLHYLLGGKWEIVTDIEIASKMLDEDYAHEILNTYYYDTNCYDDKFLVVPLHITWELVNTQHQDQMFLM